MTGLSDRVKRAMSAIGDIDRDIHLHIEAMSTDELTSLGQRLWWLGKRVTKTFDPVKNKIREAAIAKMKGVPGPCKLESEDGSYAVVTIQKPVANVRKDSNMEQVRATLGDKFDDVFVTTVQYKLKDGAEKVITTLDDNSISAVMAVIDTTNITPRVVFRD